MASVVAESARTCRFEPTRRFSAASWASWVLCPMHRLRMATLGLALAVSRSAASTVFPAKTRAPAASPPMEVTRTALVPLPHHHGVAALVALGRSLANIVAVPLSSMQACRKGLTIKVVPDMRVRACARAHVYLCHSA